MISTIEYGFHIILFAIAALTIILMGLAYTKFSGGKFKNIIMYYAIAFFFSALRWVGGSMVRLGLPITNNLSFNIIWLFAGILSACFGLYATKLLLDLSKNIGFYGKKK